jgi:membrane protease YdiL (CAAX protease family)
MILIKVFGFLVVSAGLTFILALPINFLLYWSLQLLRVPEKFLRDFLNLTGQPEIVINYFSLVPALLLASSIMTHFVERRPFATLGISLRSSWLREISIGVLLAIMLTLPLLIVTYFVAPYNPITSPSTAQDIRGFLAEAPIAMSLCLAVVTFLGAFFEELLFRGYLFQTLMSWIGKWLTVFATSIIFALSHYQTHMASAMVYAGFVGLLMAVLYLSSKSLWVAAGFHFTVNGVLLIARLIFQDARLQPGDNWPFAGTTGIMTLILAAWALKYLRSSEEMEALWQQYVPIAQPWAQLKAWWARRKNKTGNAS